MSRQIEDEALGSVACQEFLSSLTGIQLLTTFLRTEGKTNAEIAELRDIKVQAVSQSLGQVRRIATEHFGKQAVRGRKGRNRRR